MSRKVYACLFGRFKLTAYKFECLKEDFYASQESEPNANYAPVGWGVFGWSHSVLPSALQRKTKVHLHWPHF